MGKTKLGEAEFVGEKGWLRGQVKMEQRDLATLDWQATQEMRELDGYETMDSMEGKDWGATMDEEEGVESAGKLVLGSWLDCREGLVREFLGDLGMCLRLRDEDGAIEMEVSRK